MKLIINGKTLIFYFGYHPKNKMKIFNGGYLGSRTDEERSELR